MHRFRTVPPGLWILTFVLLACGDSVGPLPTTEEVAGVYLLSGVDGRPVPTQWEQTGSLTDSLESGSVALHESGAFRLTYQGSRTNADRYPPTTRLSGDRWGEFEIREDGRIAFLASHPGTYYDRYGDGRLRIALPPREGDPDRDAQVEFSRVAPRLDLAPDTLVVGAIGSSPSITITLTADGQAVPYDPSMIEVVVEDEGVALASTREVYAVAEGITTIRASAFGATDSMTLIVDQQPAHLKLGPPVLGVPAGVAAPLAVEVLDGAETVMPAPGITWESSDSGVAVVQDGRLVPGALGQARITATVDSLTADMTVHVTERGYVGLFVSTFDGWTLTPAGEVLSWGRRLDRDPGAPYPYAPPEAAPVGTGFEVVVAGFYHACALDATGQAVCWQDGQVVTVDTAAPFVQLDAAEYRTCGRTGAGQVWCWDAPTGLDPPPVAGLVSDTISFTLIAVGAVHACGLDVLGEPWCWGSNAGHRLGTDQVPVDGRSDVPVRVAGGHRFVDIGAGPSATCAVTASGEAWCWGYGWPDNNSSRPTPTRVAENVVLDRIGRGQAPLCGLTDTGAGFCWPRGDGAPASRMPVPYPLAAIAANERMGCALAENEGLFCWDWIQQEHSPGVGVAPGDSAAYSISTPIVP